MNAKAIWGRHVRVEFAIRQIAAVTDQLSNADTERAVSALMRFLDFPRTVTGRAGRPVDTKWYPAKITIVGATNSLVQRLEDAHQDSGSVKQSVLDRLIGIIADAAVSGTAADSAAWAARASGDAASSVRLWEEARKLAATCTGLALQSQCDAALN